MRINGDNINDSLKKSNNLDFIRFAAATLVIFSHSFPLTLGNNNKEPLYYLTNGQITLGHLAVSVFFIISGFLITLSFDRSKNLLYFMKSRCLRIFPALLFTVFLTTFALGPLYTSFSIIEYFGSDLTYKYLCSIFLFDIKYYLPGVFENNIYSGVINGSLWTLKYEFLFYCMVAFLGITRLLNFKIIITGFFISNLMVLFKLPIGENLIDLFRYFSFGMLTYFLRYKIKLNLNISILCIFLLITSTFLGYLEIALPILGGYLVFYLAYQDKFKINEFGKYGDFSYGLYIYAFPIQQIITNHFNNNIHPLTNFIYSFIITLGISILSWNYIEKSALKFKRSSLVLKSTKNTLIRG